MVLPKKKIAIFFSCVIIASVAIIIISSLQSNDIVTQTDKIMETVPMDCYLFYPDVNHKLPNSVELTYYKDIGIALNNTGIQYPATFMRSAAFHAFLIQNCPYLNQTRNITPPLDFRKDLALPNVNKTLSDAWITSVKMEQAVHNYNLEANPKNFTRIEDASSAFGMPLSQFTDQFFLPWNHILDVNKYQNTTATKGELFSNFIGCKNPSWRSNSDIRQCNYWNSHWIINLHTQQLMAILDAPPINATQSHA